MKKEHLYQSEEVENKGNHLIGVEWNATVLIARLVCMFFPSIVTKEILPRVPLLNYGCIFLISRFLKVVLKKTTFL